VFQLPNYLTDFPLKITLLALALTCTEALDPVVWVQAIQKFRNENIEL
jgi:hypothetical protein